MRAEDVRKDLHVRITEGGNSGYVGVVKDVTDITGFGFCWATVHIPKGDRTIVAVKRHSDIEPLYPDA